MKSTLFVVDELAPDGTYGRVLSLKKIFHNLARMPVGVTRHMNERLTRGPQEVTLFIPVGRFVCMVSFLQHQADAVMEFFDTRNSDMVAYRIANGFDSRLRNSFLLCYMKSKRNYLRNYHRASLALRTVTFDQPLSQFIAVEPSVH